MVNVAAKCRFATNNVLRLKQTPAKLNGDIVKKVDFYREFGKENKKTHANFQKADFFQNGAIRYNNCFDLSIPKINKKIFFCRFC